MSNFFTEFIPSIKSILCLSRANKLSKFHTPKFILLSGPGFVSTHPELTRSNLKTMAMISWVMINRSTQKREMLFKVLKFLDEIAFENFVQRRFLPCQIILAMEKIRTQSTRGHASESFSDKAKTYSKRDLK